MNELENFLAHYGIPGMHWGQRRGTRASENVAVSTLKKQKAHSLSDSELKQAIGRMQLEKQYRDLNPKGLSRANKIVLGLLAVGTTVNSVMAFRNSATGTAIVKLVKNALGK